MGVAAKKPRSCLGTLPYFHKVHVERIQGEAEEKKVLPTVDGCLCVKMRRTLGGFILIHMYIPIFPCAPCSVLVDSLRLRWCDMLGKRRWPWKVNPSVAEGEKKRGW